jgi:hypothetical protein
MIHQAEGQQFGVTSEVLLAAREVIRLQSLVSRLLAQHLALPNTGDATGVEEYISAAQAQLIGLLEVINLQAHSQRSHPIAAFLEALLEAPVAALACATIACAAIAMRLWPGAAISCATIALMLLQLLLLPNTGDATGVEEYISAPEICSTQAGKRLAFTSRRWLHLSLLVLLLGRGRCH